MGTMRRILYSVFGINGYLTVVRRGFFLAFGTGMLRNKAEYKWHHFVPNLLREGDTVIDIGANLGYFSNLFCRLVGKTGHVYSVEPVQPFRRQLQRQLAHATNNEIYGFALGNENLDEIVLGIPEAVRQLGYLRTGLPSILHGGNEKPDGKNTFGAALKKGSEVFAHLPRIDYIKCDIEGYETVVLNEMKDLLAARQPLVQVESWGEHMQNITALFTGMGFKGYKLYGGKLIPLHEVSQDKWGNDDTLFVPPSRAERVAPFLS